MESKGLSLRKRILLGALCLFVMTGVSVSFAQDDSAQDTAMVLIPAGPFTMGTKGESDEKPIGLLACVSQNCRSLLE